MCSDHFSPWSQRQGHSAFAWSWLGAALQATNLPFGVVNAPGQRYHAAVIAQASATLAAMYPGRFWVALGTAEASNEHITGDGWPRKEIRNARLRECVDIIRATAALAPTRPGDRRSCSRGTGSAGCEQPSPETEHSPDCVRASRSLTPAQRPLVVLGAGRLGDPGHDGGSSTRLLGR